ncbi:MAG: YitT family protein [Chloroflexi bacterium]|nr:YitT family protein [Chloroflexota bacterium]
MFLTRLKRALVDGALIVVGCILMAVAVDVFLDPNDVVPGGFTALAMFANRLWGWPIGITLLGLNLPFLIAGMILLGAQFGPRTIATAVLASVAIDALNPLLPQVRGEPLLYTVFSGLIYGLGQGLVFRANATSGGVEIPAKLLNHFHGIRMSRSIFVMDLAVLAIAAVFFGLAPALYALIVAWVTERVLSFMETGSNASQSVFIISENPEPIKEAILRRMERGVTLLDVIGGYTGARRLMIFTVISRGEVSTLRRIVSGADPCAFVVINPSSEVLGEGFGSLLQRRTFLGAGRSRDELFAADGQASECASVHGE